MIDLRTLLPLDRETILTSVKKTNKLLIVHEDTRTGGIAGEIAAIVCEGAFEDLDGPDRARDGSGHAGAVRAAARGKISAEYGKGCRGRARIGKILTRRKQAFGHGKNKGRKQSGVRSWTEVRIADRAFLEKFLEAGQYHNELEPEQLEYAGRTAKVKAVSFFHGGDEIYTLRGRAGRVARGMSDRGLSVDRIGEHHGC